jgi:cell division protein FtsI/penicillin-binding protein 2
MEEWELREKDRRRIKEHEKHVAEHRKMAEIVEDMMDIDKLFKEHFAKHVKAIKKPYTQWAVDDWMEFDIDQSERRKYPNAKKAHQLQNSKLSKILK